MDKIKTGANSTYKKLAVESSADTFVVNQTLVLRINIYGKNRQLLVAANRWQQLGGFVESDTNDDTVRTSKTTQTRTLGNKLRYMVELDSLLSSLTIDKYLLKLY